MSKRQLLVRKGRIDDERTLINRLNEVLSFSIYSTNNSISDAQLLTQAQYNALTTPDSDTIYFTSDTLRIYVGTLQFV